MSHFIQKERILTLYPRDVKRCIGFLTENQGAVLVGAKGRIEISGVCPSMERCNTNSCYVCESRRSTYRALKEILANEFGKVQENSGTWTEARMRKIPNTDLMVLRTPVGGVVLFQGSDGEKGAYVIKADTTIVYRERRD